MSALKPTQVHPLPIGSGGNSALKQQMNQTNTQLAMLTAQATANTKYDPPVPQPVTKQVIKEHFQRSRVNSVNMIFVIGGLFIVYGLVAK